MLPDCRPIIIGGFYRSGTTLLRRLLDAHSQVHCPPEIKFFRDLRLDFQDDPYAHLRFFATVRVLPASTEELLATVGQGYLTLRSQAAARLGKPVWADKDPENALYLEHWRALLPGGFRYLHLARHPLDMLASASEAGFSKSLPATADVILSRWLENCRAARRHMERHPADSLLLRYEDLVQRPAERLAELFSWLRLPFEPEVLALFADPARGRGIEDPKAARSPVIHAGSVGRGRRELAPEKVRSLLDRCGEELAWLGYGEESGGPVAVPAPAAVKAERGAVGRRRLVVVLGMHRSGTSALTRGLPALGVALGDALLAAEPGDNDKGYFEDTGILGLNAAILRHFDCDWDSLLPPGLAAGALPIPPAFRDQARELLRERTGRFPLFGIKDPRLCLLLPFWQEVFRELALEVDYLLAVRHPLSVARSLARRELPVAISPLKSHLLWLRHEASALRHTRGCRRLVVDFDLLLDDPEGQLRRLAAGLDLEVDEALLAEYAGDFLDSGLRHTRFAASALQADESVPPGVAHLYAHLSALAGDRLAGEGEEEASLLRLVEGILQEQRPLLAGLVEQERALARLHLRTAEFEFALADREREIADLLASTSWRLTRPLRAVGRIRNRLKAALGAAGAAS